MFLALDIGTSFIKGAILDLSTNQILNVTRVPFPRHIPHLPSLYREIDPDAIIRVVRSLIDTLMPTSCDGIFITSQMHGTILTTKEGIARSNFVTWQDQRILQPHPSGEGSYIEVLQQRLDPDEIRQLGNELRPGFPIGLLFWLVESGQLLPEPHLIPTSVADFIVANLCSTRPVTDLTNAAAHGLLNLETLSWHESVIEKLNISQFDFPEIQPHGSITGWFPWNNQRIPIYTPVGDYQCALLGTLLQEREISLNISTGSQVSLLSRTLVFGNFQTRIYFDGKFTKTITHIPAGRALNVLITMLSELAVAQGVQISDPWAYITQQAAAINTTAIETNLAFYNSSIGNSGSITHIHESSFTIGHLFRSAFQSMAENYYTCALRLSPDQDWSNLVFSGGLPQKVDLLRSVITTRFDAPYRMSPHSEDTLHGLLILAYTFTGKAESIEQATKLIRATFAGE